MPASNSTRSASAAPAAQTSDTDITSTRMRRINLLHAVVSYFFNTVLIAAAVNGAVSLAG